ncbi:uncharacterized protein [Pyxicephalus adspersus]|uniref:uncharacterized protein isoform X1 n=1 Tax=Pyxicephalus adspersus TaxID=30357 RepID=UPI003B59A79B
MANSDNFKIIQSTFQREFRENPGAKPITQVRPGAKPVIPAKPNIQIKNDHFFQKPVPKAISSPELASLPKSDPLNTTVNQLQSHQSFSFQSNSSNYQDTSAKRPLLPFIKTLPVPKPSVNISHHKISTNIPDNAVATNKTKFEKSSPPRLKVLPTEDVLRLKPRKPARPPFVDLEKFTRSNTDFGDYVMMKSFAVPNQRQARLTASQSQPNLTTCYPSQIIRNSLREKQAYKDVPDFSAIKKSNSTSSQVVISKTTGQDNASNMLSTIEKMNKVDEENDRQILKEDSSARIGESEREENSDILDNIVEEASKRTTIQHMRCAVHNLQPAIRDGLKGCHAATLICKLRQVTVTARAPKTDAILKRRA